ncbi:SMC-Scp complex subunit ScpB [Picrophilus oshimae]|uniref:Condensin subunit ScpB n=1 Tax=Picrophilus torridus (strain ATCC 700027 / DSM 9790 / JCM 10055 / NBRC 100828 / KAW 2/3) TaxID=1122961 RepID=A0A8G2FVB3_PICTO|nr:SMC-Scp complex subunit ScpB [Picrophilus oshimae]SMD30152.1 condensin subunit ScpB [Picrophilus oshimae DSM 9789]
MDDLSRKVEAILYSCEEPLKVSDIADYLKVSNDDVIRAMKLIARSYNEINSTLEIKKIGNKYKIQLSNDFNDVVYPFVKKDLDKKDIAMLSYIYGKPGVIAGELRENFGYNFMESVKKLKAEKLITSHKYRNTFKYHVTKNFYVRFNVKDDKK